VLNCGDKADGLIRKQGKGLREDRYVEIHSPRLEDYIFPLVYWYVPEMNEHIRIPIREGIECEVTGTITGIAADSDFESCIFQVGGDRCSLSFEPFWELEGDLMCPPFFEFL